MQASIGLKRTISSYDLQSASYEPNQGRASEMFPISNNEILEITKLINKSLVDIKFYKPLTEGWLTYANNIYKEAVASLKGFEQLTHELKARKVTAGHPSGKVAPSLLEESFNKLEGGGGSEYDYKLSGEDDLENQNEEPFHARLSALVVTILCTNYENEKQQLTGLSLTLQGMNHYFINHYARKRTVPQLTDQPKCTTSENQAAEMRLNDSLPMTKNIKILRSHHVYKDDSAIRDLLEPFLKIADSISDNITRAFRLGSMIVGIVDKNKKVKHEYFNHMCKKRYVDDDQADKHFKRTHERARKQQLRLFLGNNRNWGECDVITASQLAPLSTKHVAGFECVLQQAQGRREKMEDRVVADSILIKAGLEEVTIPFFAVLDGHVNVAVAAYCQEKLPSVLGDQLAANSEHGLQGRGVLQALRDSCVMLHESAGHLWGGTTLTLSMIHENKVYTASVGDSRSIMINQTDAFPLTCDASTTEEWAIHDVMLRGGIIKDRRVQGVYNLNMTRSIGDFADQEVLVHYPQVSRHDLVENPCNYLLLYSDGLSEVASDAQLQKSMMEMVQEGVSLQNMAQKIVSSALRYSGDNISLIIVKLS